MSPAKITKLICTIQSIALEERVTMAEAIEIAKIVQKQDEIEYRKELLGKVLPMMKKIATASGISMDEDFGDLLTPQDVN